MVRVAINGFGRIGRCFLRSAWHDPEIEIVAINDLGDVKNLAYLLQYDTVYGRFSGQVSAEQGELVVGAKHIKFLSEKDPAKLPWKGLGVDIVVESTGLFTDFEKAKVHLDAGARRVVISAPAHGEHDTGEHPLGATVLVGINEERLATCTISSNASCTTNAASPVIQILHEALGVELALLNTTHAYTASQRIVDSPNTKDFREGRAGAQNMIPSSTGAATAVAKAIPELKNKFDGIAVRVPVVAGSLADVTFIAARPTTVEEVNQLLEAAARSERWQGIFTTSRDPLVSSDIVGEPYGSIADLALTRVVGGKLVKVMAWYDNEMGYAHTLLRHVKASGKYI
ncbi:type I glyceraldehyde-3-phosphate dehydrogenase [Candidatus Adlerbacteria bacterium RIFCSPHIGHO2_02_FULL_54_18]|uniref:Type I glyceraldehyde-3-phosphate dehydrogenase n=2 Tax=Candidatus Adleribacteriota TaxID=1752736 RepID=A0A1F4Y317_9BACT|nr:MAG: type I glyceraldehyde-3-phosphate dehydrogenase [Candidatus Adlerbacteria bacterium RIFCSPLOWO2_01_FULL_54_21b]OGC88264.1 MAG: type I glyceraldehyde-3-phosphate dehydrogenase [Candidatus Adlerbacteria bacterium RIFCSPHIGHO2_02_FULL_54_18]